MKHHLQERPILDYLFRLSDPKKTMRIEQHLADCPDCRRRAEWLQQRFATLETLRETEEASERLIAQTLRRIRTDQATARETRFPVYAWLGGAAAAAALLLAFFFVVPRLGREPAVELARLEAPQAAPAAPAMEPPAGPPHGAEATLARSASEISSAGWPVAMRQEVSLEAEQILAEAAEKPPVPALAMATKGAVGARRAVELNEARPSRTAAPMKEKRAGGRVRKVRAVTTEPSVRRVPRGWSYAPTNQVCVLLIPLKSKADSLFPPPVEGFRTIHWQIRVRNDSGDPQTVRVTKLFEQPGWDFRLLNEEGRVVEHSDVSVVIETEVPAGSLRAVHCVLSEPLDSMPTDRGETVTAPLP